MNFIDTPIQDVFKQICVYLDEGSKEFEYENPLEFTFYLLFNLWRSSTRKRIFNDPEYARFFLKTVLKIQGFHEIPESIKVKSFDCNTYFKILDTIEPKKSISKLQIAKSIGIDTDTLSKWLNFKTFNLKDTFKGRKKLNRIEFLLIYNILGMSSKKVWKKKELIVQSGMSSIKIKKTLSADLLYDFSICNKFPNAYAESFIKFYGVD